MPVKSNSKVVTITIRLTADRYTELVYIGKRLGLFGKREGLKDDIDQTATIDACISMTKKELTEPTIKFNG